MEVFDTWTTDHLTEQNAAFTQAMEQAGYSRTIFRPIDRHIKRAWEWRLSTSFEAKFPWAWPLGPDPYWRSSDMKTIVKQVAKKHGISVREIRGHSKKRKVCIARHEAFWRCRKEGPVERSYPQIGRYFGSRDHTTVIHGVNRHQERLLNGTAR